MALSDESVERLAEAVKQLMATTQQPRPWWDRFVVPLITVISAAFAAYLAVKVDIAQMQADLSSLTGQVTRMVTLYDDMGRWKESHLTGHAQPSEQQPRSGRR